MQCGIVRCDDILWLSIVYILQYALITVPMDAHFLHCLVWGIGSDVEAFFKHGDYWLVYEKDGPLQIQGRYGSNRMFEGLKASLEGVAISGRLLGPSTKPDGTLKFPKIEIPPATEKKFLSVLVDGKEVNSNVTTPQYAIEFGRVPSVQHYEANKYFLDKTGTVFQNPEWKNYMSVGLTVTLFAMGDEVAKIVVNQGPVQDLLIVISSRLADPTSGMTKGLTGHCGAGTFGASEIPDPNNLPFLVDPKDSLFSWKHATLGQEAPKESCTSTLVDGDIVACAMWFNDHQSLGNFLEHSAELKINECVEDCCNNYYDASTKIDHERPYMAPDYHYLDPPCQIPFGPLKTADEWILSVSRG